MRLSALAALSILSATTISAQWHPFEERSTHDLYIRNAEAYADAYAEAYANALIEAETAVPGGLGRRDAFNKEEAKEGFQKAEKYEEPAETAVCTVGAFIPGADVAIDAACLASAAVKGGHAAYKKMEAAKQVQHNKRALEHELLERELFEQSLYERDLYERDMDLYERDAYLDLLLDDYSW